jgi:hypothetical protein
VGGTRQRRFDGTSFKPHKLLENAQTPTSRVHALLGALIERQPRELKQAATAELTKLWHMTQTFAIDKKHNLPKHWPSESQSQWKNRLCQRMKLYQPARLKPARNFDHRNPADYPAVYSFSSRMPVSANL